MWARIVECMLGIWLLLSPFIFSHADRATAQWITDLGAGSLFILLSLFSYWKPTAWAHVLILPVAGWLIGFGRFWHEPPLGPGFQNEILVGLIALMIAVVPTGAAQPPRRWERHLNSERQLRSHGSIDHS